MSLDASKNETASASEALISQAGCLLAAFVIPTDEELLIARDTVHCILGEPHPS